MLRRKLLLNVGPLVALLLLMAVVAILLLQNVLRDMEQINTQAWGIVDQVNELSININDIEADLYQLQIGRQRHLDSLIDKVEAIHQFAEKISTSYVVHQPQCEADWRRIVEQIPQFQQHVGALATVQDPDLARHHNEAALNAAVAMRQGTLPLSRYVRAHAHMEQEALSSWFHWVVLGLALVFLIVINVSVIVLLRMGSMVVRPIEKLVTATRQFGDEHFDYRIHLEQNDEFGELARAYNSLGEQLQSNEQQRIQTLSQVAVMMNHELNNAIATIDLQLAMLSRRTADKPASETHLRQIQESLQRVTRTVQSLKNVRRIVLTDYVPGTKMLDLERSTEEDHSCQPISGAHPL